MKRFRVLLIVLFFSLVSLGFSARYTLQFKNKDTVEGDLIKDDGVQVTLKLDSGSSLLQNPD